MSHAAAGFFGKLPCRGDFLQRRVSREFLDVWDSWLQRCIGESVRRLQDRWLDAYLTGPVWRFVLSEGICGASAYAGVVVPSVDRVGRYFPLTIVSQWPSQSPIETACNARAWFDAAEALALTAPDTTDLEVFDASVSRLTAAAVDTAAIEEAAQLRELVGDSEFPQRATQWHVPLASVHSLQRAVNALALRELERSLRPLSLWWSDGSDDVEAAWLCARGLPVPESFAAMLSGEWRPMGWSSVGAGTLRRASVEPAVPQRIDVTAAHEPVNRSWDAEPTAYFSSRPEVGLWGVSSVGAEAGPAAAQAMADVLQSVRPAASLSILVEEVRNVIEGVQRQLARSALSDATSLANVIVFVASGGECALVCSGTVQALRCRASEVTPVVGIGPYEAAAVPAPVRDAAAVNGTLLDLVTGSAVSCVAPEEKSSVRVCYESLRADDRWLIAGDALFDETQLPWLAAAMKQESTNPMAAVRSACAAGAEQSALPVMLLSARATSVRAGGQELVQG